MPTPVNMPLDALEELAQSLASLRGFFNPPREVDHVSMHLSALRYHVGRVDPSTRVVVVLGGTGTGKSTLVNRLLGADISHASSLRTFTAGAVAVVATTDALPDGFADLPVADAPTTPTRGEPDRLTRVVYPASRFPSLVLVDTPDVDGSLPEHHTTAERLFRFADVVVFVTTPEKYQMTELWPFYQLGRRYHVPSLFVMNKVDAPGPAEDFELQLHQALGTAAAVYQVARDDSLRAIDPSRSLDALRDGLALLAGERRSSPCRGHRQRAEDLARRIEDTLLQPLETRRRAVDESLRRLEDLGTPRAGVDVGEVAADLAHRLRQKSVLYLLGLPRVWEHVRQLPGAIAGLPRSAWERLSGTRGASRLEAPPGSAAPLPDFRQELVDKFLAHHARLDELLRPFGDTQAEWKTDPDHAGRIADEELDGLRQWLAQRWDSEPRDTRLVRKLLRRLPGGDRLIPLSEAAPYLLTIACVVKGAALGPVDLVVLGAYSFATWLLERLSSEVRAKVHETNVRIGQRFAALVEKQTEQARRWLDAAAPSGARVAEIRRRVERLLELMPTEAREP